MKNNIYAVIDVGSNSVRLMIHNGFSTLSKEMLSSKLAKNMVNGILDIDSIDRTVDAIVCFVSKAKELTDKIYIFATEALRKAYNKEMLIEKVKMLTNIDIDVVSGYNEAKLGFVGASKNRDCTIVDIGGASTEIVSGKNGNIEYAESMPVGAVVLADKCSENYSMLSKYLKKNLLFGKIPFKNEVIAIGGTATTLCAVIYQVEPYDRNIVNGKILYREQILECLQKLKTMPLSERLKIKGLQKGREDIIIGAIYELLYIMDLLQVVAITISEDDNLEGYLFENILKK